LINKESKQNTGCPCGNSDSCNNCCGRYIDGGENAPSPEALMRSRYCAYTLGKSDYLLNTWHESTRPDVLELQDDKTRWSGLTIVSAAPIAEDATKINGKAGKLHERSRFVKQGSRWYYVDGEVKS